MMIFMARNQFTPGTGSELKGKTLGIHAYGNVGRLVGRLGKAMGMQVKAYDPFIKDGAVFEADGVQAVDSVEALYAAAITCRCISPPPSRPKRASVTRC